MTTEEKKALLDKNLDGAIRGFVWGLPPTVILENEKGTFAGEEDGRLFYIDNIVIGEKPDKSDLKKVRATIGYDFVDDALWRARVFIEKKYLDPQERVRDLLEIRTQLMRKYGDPVDEYMIWHDKKEQNWPDAWGWAVLRGELMMTITFRNEETEVVAFLGAREKLNPNVKDPEFNITYTSLEQRERLKDNAKRDLLKLP